MNCDRLPLIAAGSFYIVDKEWCSHPQNKAGKFRASSWHHQPTSSFFCGFTDVFDWCRWAKAFQSPSTYRRARQQDLVA